MGDLSAEPSMEDILSSIKRIIAEDGDASPARGRRAAKSTAAAPDAEPIVAGRSEEILELNDPMPQPVPIMPQPAAPASAARAPAPPAAADPVAPIVSHGAAAATRGSLDTLSRLMVKPEPASDGTLEGLVREMLRPMLRDWLDSKLPEMVEAMVAREIERITGQQG